MSDVIRPIKQFLPKYKEIENNFLEKVYNRFGLGQLSPDEELMVKSIDDDLLDYDMAMLLKEDEPEGGFRLKRIPDIEYRVFEEVEKEYLDIFYRYFKEEI